MAPTNLQSCEEVPFSGVARGFDARFKAMGTEVRVIIVGGNRSLVRLAKERVDDLERRWSRFLGDTELSVLNGSLGSPVKVSDVTFALIDRAKALAERTGGLFDPTVGDAVIDAGYDRSFDQGLPEVWPRVSRIPAPGWGRIQLDPELGTVTVPEGVRLDLGAIGHGRAADVVVEELIGAGAAGALVDIGGDMRAEGEHPGATAGWVLHIQSPTDPEAQTASVEVLGGAVATSTTARHRWPTSAGYEHHHLIDPRSGRPAVSNLLQVSVLARDATTAEAFATAAMVAGEKGGTRLLDEAGFRAILVRADHSVTVLGPD